MLGPILASIAGLLFAILQPQPATRPAAPSLILACEQSKSRVVLLDAAREWDDPKAIVWEWSAEGAKEIAAAEKAWYRNPSEAKEMLGGTHIALCGGGGVALVRVKDRVVVFHAKGPGNPHSVELLPDGNFVVAGSSSDTVRVYCTEDRRDPAQPPVFSDAKLTDAHGLLWDADRKRLWAMGGKTLKAFEYNFERARPSLKETLSLPLPETAEGKLEPRYGGHDLSRVPGKDLFYITDEHYLWIFDPATSKFSPMPQVNGRDVHATKDIKSLSQVEPNGPILIMHATKQWWSDTLLQLGSDWKKTLPSARFYKARWWMGEAPKADPDAKRN